MFLKIFVQCLLLSSVVESLSKHPILLIISYDAFRYDYFETRHLPYMSKIRKEGTFTDFMYNVFPTKTFPNHHSIATGLYPESHGIIANRYFNFTTKKVENFGPEMYAYSPEIKPIWRWNEDQGKGRYSGSMMWPGTTFSYQGKNITHIHEFAPQTDWNERIDIIISWLKHPVKPANLIMIYFEEPDRHTHALGPNSPISNAQLQRLDNLTRYMDMKLEEHKLTDKVNIIQLADHGMKAVQYKHFINITKYLQPNTYLLVGTSPVLQLIPKQGYLQKCYVDLVRGAKENGHFRVYQAKDYLERWHYANSRRTPPITIIADEGYALEDYYEAAIKYADRFKFKITNDTEFGVHGYECTVKEMTPFFMARGPRIKTKHHVPPFNNVDLFKLFCEILEIPSTPNNGTLKNIIDILNKPYSRTTTTEKETNEKYTIASIVIIAVIGILIAIILISSAAVLTLFLIKRQQTITTTAALNKRFPQTFQSTIEAQHLLEPEEA